MAFIFIDEDREVITTKKVLDWMKKNGRSYRRAAKHFGTSASTLCRFMRRNGYRVELSAMPEKESK